MANFLDFLRLASKEVKMQEREDEREKFAFFPSSWGKTEFLFL